MPFQKRKKKSLKSYLKHSSYIALSQSIPPSFFISSMTCPLERTKHFSLPIYSDDILTRIRQQNWSRRRKALGHDYFQHSQKGEWTLNESELDLVYELQWDEWIPEAARSYKTQAMVPAGRTSRRERLTLLSTFCRWGGSIRPT